MTGAMYAAIGGLKSHMTKLNVIGNNVANVNTHGYKAQRMTFMESIYTTSKSGSNGGVARGGNNPSQIGYGCSVGSIDLNMAPSTYAPTGWGLDCMLTGEGFFMTGDKLEQTTKVDDKGKITESIWTGGITKGSEVSQLNLSRVGDFWVDADGYICNRDNQVLFGFARVQNPKYPDPKNPDEPETIISTHLVPLRVPLSAAAPTKANKGIIEEKGADGKTVLKYNWKEGDPVYPFLDTDDGGTNQYACPDVDDVGRYTDLGVATLGTGSSLIPVAKNTAEDAVSDVMPIQLKSMQISADGSITGIAPNGQTVVIGYAAVATVDSPDGVTHMDGRYYKAMGGAGNVRVSCLGLDLNGNGTVAYLGNQVATAGDANNPGTTPPANDAILVEKKTQVKNGGLEASSTDVANEFAEMITTQRGYQANTRIVTVTDQMLEELVNMKR